MKPTPSDLGNLARWPYDRSSFSQKRPKKSSTTRFMNTQIHTVLRTCQSFYTHRLLRIYQHQDVLPQHIQQTSVVLENIANYNPVQKHQTNTNNFKCSPYLFVFLYFFVGQFSASKKEYIFLCPCCDFFSRCHLLVSPKAKAVQMLDSPNCSELTTQLQILQAFGRLTSANEWWIGS